jgi:hypothetical protein
LLLLLLLWYSRRPVRFDKDLTEVCKVHIVTATSSLLLLLLGRLLVLHLLRLLRRDPQLRLLLVLLLRLLILLLLLLLRVLHGPLLRTWGRTAGRRGSFSWRRMQRGPQSKQPDPPAGVTWFCICAA